MDYKEYKKIIKGIFGLLEREREEYSEVIIKSIQKKLLFKF